MKALTLTEPWATLVAIGAKRIETRSWGTSYRGPVAIHAAKGMPQWAEMVCYDEPFFSVLRNHLPTDVIQKPATAWFSRGHVIATAEIDGCVQISKTHDPIALANFGDYAAENEALFGDYAVGRWLWLLSHIEPIAAPVPVRGALGLWDWEQA